MIVTRKAVGLLTSHRFGVTGVAPLGPIDGFVPYVIVGDFIVEANIVTGNVGGSILGFDQVLELEQVSLAGDVPARVTGQARDHVT